MTADEILRLTLGSLVIENVKLQAEIERLKQELEKSSKSEAS